MKILGLKEGASLEEVAAKLLDWEAHDFETAAREAGMCATMCRTAEEWKSTDVGHSVQSWLDDNHGCPVRVIKVAHQGTSYGNFATVGHSMRVIDMSRVIAAPVAGRTLASELIK